MRLLFLLVGLLATPGLLRAQCKCENDSLMSFNIGCDETKLSNGSKLYYQFNCDSVWLILENTHGTKHLIFSDRDLVALHGYVYRLGYQLVREYQKSLLFRYGCPANGPCTFVLHDKNTGKKIEEFDHLIYGDEDEDDKNFILYFADTTLSKVILYYIDADKRYTFSINAKRLPEIWAHPAFCFSKPEINASNVMTLTYGNYRHFNYEKAGTTRPPTEKLVIDLNKYKP